MPHKFDVYVSDHSEAALKAHSVRTAAGTAAYLLKSILPNMKICDVGCGPGSITTDFAELVPDGQVIGVDMGYEGIERAKQTAAERGVKNVKFQVGDAHVLEFPDHTFDIVHAHQVLLHLADPVKALREMRRVTKPGGIVACCDADLDSAVIYPETQKLAGYTDFFVKTARSRGAEPNGGRHLVAWARKSGIDRSCITATAKVWCYSDAEERRWWGGIVADRIGTPLGKNAIDAGVATQEDVDRFIEGWREWSANEDAWYTITHGEILCRV